MAGRRGLSTLNVEELKKFEAIAAEWWSLNGPAKGLHSMNGVRVPFVCDNLLKAQGKSVSDDLPLKNTKIIDIGCGGGILSEALARLGASVVGLDPCEANIKAAKLHASDTGSLADRLVYLPMTAEDYLSQHDKNEPFDAVVASEVIEHVDNPKEFVNVCSKFVPVGGSLFFTTINRTTKSWLGAIIVAENVLGLLPAGTHEWKKFITTQELTAMMEDSGASVRLFHGMFYIPGLNKWTWFPDTSVNYALHAIKAR